MDAHDHSTRVGDQDGIARTRALLRRRSAVRGTLKLATELDGRPVLSRTTKRYQT